MRKAYVQQNTTRKTILSNMDHTKRHS